MVRIDGGFLWLYIDALEFYSEAVIMTSVSRPARYLSLLSSPVTNMSIGSPFIHPPQMPSMSFSSAASFIIGKLAFDFQVIMLDKYLTMRSLI